jgi:hypothetical protein
MSFNHYFSRRWPSTLLVGLALAIIMGGIFLWLFPESSSIVAYPSSQEQANSNA